MARCDACDDECEVPPRPPLRRDELSVPDDVEPDGPSEPVLPDADAMDAWQSARARAERREGDSVGRRLAALTLHLHAELHGAEHDSMRRALLESALEVSEPPYDAEMAALLSAEALEAGDAAAAEDWLRRVDVWPERRRAHVAYSLSVARVATARRQWARVLEVLGASSADFEAAGDEALTADLLRAHALEETATVEDARLALVGAVERHGPEALALQASRVVPKQVLCPKARQGSARAPKPRPERAPRPRPRASSDARWLLWGTVVIGLLALLSATQHLTIGGRPFEQLLLVLALATGVAYLIARPRRR